MRDHGVLRSVCLNGGDPLPCPRAAILETEPVGHDRGATGVASPHLRVWYVVPDPTGGDSDE